MKIKFKGDINYECPQCMNDKSMFLENKDKIFEIDEKKSIPLEQDCKHSLKLELNIDLPNRGINIHLYSDRLQIFPLVANIDYEIID